jgi:hypothetical protein
VDIVVSGTHLPWSGSFRQLDYTMHEARPNDDDPYITGDASHAFAAGMVVKRGGARPRPTRHAIRLLGPQTGGTD